MDSVEGTLRLLFTFKQQAQVLQIPSFEKMWHKLVRYKLDMGFRRPVVHENDNRGA